MSQSFAGTMANKVAGLLAKIANLQVQNSILRDAMLTIISNNNGYEAQIAKKALERANMLQGELEATTPDSPDSSLHRQ